MQVALHGQGLCAPMVSLGLHCTAAPVRRAWSAPCLAGLAVEEKEQESSESAWTLSFPRNKHNCAALPPSPAPEPAPGRREQPRAEITRRWKYYLPCAINSLSCTERNGRKYGSKHGTAMTKTLYSFSRFATNSIVSSITANTDSVIRIVYIAAYLLFL